MCFIKEKDSKFIRHYTNVGALFGILDKGFMLSKPNENWDDQNDYFTLKKYAEHMKKDVYVLCFCDGLGSVHHWFYYGQNNKNTFFEKCYENIKCNIKLNKKAFENKLSGDLSLKKVEYVLSNKEATRNPNSTTKTLAEYVDSWDKLPYVKRKEYDVEKEWRIVALRDEGDKPEPLPILDCVESITFLIDEDSFIYCMLKNMIKCKYPQLECKIDNSGVHKSKIWENEINKIINSKFKDYEN